MFGAGTGTELMPMWLEPDDNGSAIERYRLQWKSGSQNFNAARSLTTDNLRCGNHGTHFGAGIHGACAC